MRYLAFLLAIAIGVGLGLAYGWLVNPVELVDTAPSSLRADFKADTVLMVAEVYSVNADLDWAARQLGALGGQPLETALAAESFANQVGYEARDLALLRALTEALKGWNAPADLTGVPTP